MKLMGAVQANLFKYTIIGPVPQEEKDADIKIIKFISFGDGFLRTFAVIIVEMFVMSNTSWVVSSDVIHLDLLKLGIKHS